MSTKPVETVAELVEKVAKGAAWAAQARQAADLYERTAARWWDGLSEKQRTEWLDRAEADGRERHPLSAYTLMGDLRD